MRNKWVQRIFFVIGLLLCLYPLVSSLVARQFQKGAVSTYEKEIAEKVDDVEIMLEEANRYNSMLFQTKKGIGMITGGILSDESYEGIINPSGTGIMGSLEIPKISVNLPIYHGTNEEVLSNGVGHIQGTSLPVGGNSTHSFLTGHRGLPNSKLFTRLDEIIKNDLFFVRVGNETLAYQVKELKTVLPEDVDILTIEPEKDLVSLVTCTPYGLNTHRLIVTGQRIDFEEKEYEEIKPAMMGWREMLFALLPFIFIALAVVKIMSDRRRKK